MKLDKLFAAGLIGDCLALIAGALLTLGFAPFGIYPIAILSPALMLGLWLLVTPRRAFVRGLLFGIGLFSTGVYWVFISIYNYGHAPLPLAVIITSLFILVLALFPAFNGYLFARYFPQNNASKLFCAFPAMWVLTEWIRSWAFSGFPWLITGYTQINTPLIGFAPFCSVYCVSLAVVLSSALLVSMIRHAHFANYKSLYLNLLGLVSIWLLGAALTFIPWASPQGKPLTVSLVQGNIDQDAKWSSENIRFTLQHYMQLTNWKSDIVVWPESAIPLPLQSAQDFVNKLNDFTKAQDIAFFTGIPVKVDGQDAYLNTVIELGNNTGSYVKHHLVPFGEFVPLRKWFDKYFDILKIISMTVSDFQAATKPPEPMYAKGISIAAFICYEIAYPEQVVNQFKNANLILTVTNDAWFTHSIAQAQHLEMAQMRAIELARPVLFVSNNGITATINARGKIQETAPQYKDFVLKDVIQPTTGATPWQLFRLSPLLIALGFMLAFAKVREQNLKFKSFYGRLVPRFLRKTIPPENPAS